MTDQLKKTFSEDQINQISDFIFSELKTKDRIKLGEVYEHFSFITMTKIMFCVTLSNTIKSNRFPNVVLKRGRYGGIRLDKPKPESLAVLKLDEKEKGKLKPTPSGISNSAVQSARAATIANLVPEKPEKDKRIDYSKVVVIKKEDKWGTTKKNDLYIDGKRYISTMESYEFSTIVEKVLELKSTKEGGRIKFGENRYNCTDEQAKMLDKLLFYCFGANILVSSDKNKEQPKYPWEENVKVAE